MKAIALFFLSFIAVSNSAIAQSKITATDGDPTDLFGHAIKMDNAGQYAIVGAYWDEDGCAVKNCIKRGSAYLFSRSCTKWEQLTKLSPDPGTEHQFGESVGISGSGAYAIVGAPGGTNSNTLAYPGACYVYKEITGSWVFQQKILGENWSDYFGSSVDMDDSGERIIIGARGVGTGSNDKGAVYIYTLNAGTWVLQKKIPSPGPMGFGSAVAISGDGNYCVVGALNGDGTAYIYMYDGISDWTLATPAISGFVGAKLGNSVAVDGTGSTVVIGGEQGKNNSGIKTGIALVYIRTGSIWSSQAVLIPFNGSADDRFGSSVSISDNGQKILVGAYFKTNGTFTKLGAAYVYERTGSAWNFTEVLIPADGSQLKYFGASVSLSSTGDYSIIGAERDSEKGTDSGSAYVYGGCCDQVVQNNQLHLSLMKLEGNLKTVTWLLVGSILLSIGLLFKLFIQ